MGRVYAITDEATVTIIDTGLELSTPRVLTQLKTAGYEPSQVTRILITHAHPDHIGGLPTLRAATGAKVFCSTMEKPILEGDTHVVLPNKDEQSALDKLINSKPQMVHPVPVDVALNIGDVIDSAMGPLQVISAAGHTPGQIAFWQAGRKTLLCGDAMMNLWGLTLPFSAFTQSIIQARATVKQLAALNPAMVGFGHGQPLTSDTAVKVQAFANKL